MHSFPKKSRNKLAAISTRRNSKTVRLLSL